METWNIHNRILNGCPTTNNPVESWHSTIDMLKNPTLFSILEEIQKEQHKTECCIIRLDARPEALKQITKKRSQKAKNILKMVKDYNTYDKFTFLLNMSQNMGEHDNKIQW